MLKCASWKGPYTVTAGTILESGTGTGLNSTNLGLELAITLGAIVGTAFVPCARVICVFPLGVTLARLKQCTLKSQWNLLGCLTRFYPSLLQVRPLNNGPAGQLQRAGALLPFHSPLKQEAAGERVGTVDPKPV